MEIVVDTVSLKHLLRKPRRSAKQSASSKRNPHDVTVLDRPIRLRKVTVALDYGKGLQSEWEKTCGREAIRVLIIHWEAMNAIVFIKKIEKFAPQINNKLRRLGLTGTVDKLILRLAYTTRDRKVISDDNDFWNPARPRDRGNPSAPVAKFCNEALGIEILLIKHLLDRV